MTATITCSIVRSSQVSENWIDFYQGALKEYWIQLNEVNVLLSLAEVPCISLQQYLREVKMHV